MTRIASAVVFPRPNEVEIRSVHLPDVGPDDVGVRTIFSGVSQGTERWVLTGRYNRMGDDPRHFFPAVPGYQAAGIIEEVGGNVSDLHIGDQVFLQGTRLADDSIRWPERPIAPHVGYLVSDRSAVTRVDPSVDLAGASLFRMAGVSRHGVRLTGVEPEDVVVVIGQGIIGQMSAQAARARGARVITADLIPLRVEASALYSADRAVDVSVEDLQTVVKEEAPDGADVVIDTTGNSGMFGTCLDLVRHEGRICLQGYYPDPIEIDFHPTHLKRPTVTFPCGWDEADDREIATDLAAARVTIAPLITHRVDYREAPSAYEMVVAHPEKIIGLVLNWSHD